MPPTTPPQPASRREQRYQQQQAQRRRRIVWAVVTPVVVLALVGIGVLVASNWGGDDEPPFTGTVLTMELGEYYISGDLTAPAGAIRIEAVNVGRDKHNIGIRRVKISREMQPGDSLTLDVGELAAGEYELFCDVLGHVEAGQVATLTIT